MEFLRLYFVDLVNSGILPDFFKYGFVINSIIASFLIGPILGGIGTMVIIKKMAFFSEAIGHAALAGIAIGVLLTLLFLHIYYQFYLQILFVFYLIIF